MNGRNTAWLTRRLNSIGSNSLIFSSLLILSEYVKPGLAASEVIDYIRINATNYLLNTSTQDRPFEFIRKSLLDGVCGQLTVSNATDADYESVWRISNNDPGQYEGSVLRGELLREFGSIAIKGFEGCSFEYAKAHENEYFMEGLTAFIIAALGAYYYFVCCYQCTAGGAANRLRQITASETLRNDPEAAKENLHLMAQPHEEKHQSYSSFRI